MGGRRPARRPWRGGRVRRVRGWRPAAAAGGGYKSAALASARLGRVWGGEGLLRAESTQHAALPGDPMASSLPVAFDAPTPTHADAGTVALTLRPGGDRDAPFELAVSLDGGDGAQCVGRIGFEALCRRGSGRRGPGRALGACALRPPGRRARRDAHASPPPSPGARVGARVEPGAASLFYDNAAGVRTVLASAPGAGFAPARASGTAFWLSYDGAPAGAGLKYGRGYVVEAAVLLAAAAPAAAVAPGGPLARAPHARRALVRGAFPDAPVAASGPHAARLAARGDRARPPAVWCSPRPLSFTPSPLASARGAPSSLATLGDASAPVRFDDLPPTCRQLLAAVTAPGVGLGAALAAAISRSLRGGALAARLAAKAVSSTTVSIPYLRVAVAAPARCAPGEPFVLELWPAGAASPVHAHGGAAGVFRVLHGACYLRTFNAAGADGPGPRTPHFAAGPLTAGALGWFDSGHHQTHQIEAVPGPPGSFCATLQAFRYETPDEVRCPFMEVEAATTAEQDSPRLHHAPPTDFEPVSDYGFAELAALVLGERAAALGGEEGGGGGVPAPAASAHVTGKRVRGASDEGGEDMDSFVWTI